MLDAYFAPPSQQSNLPLYALKYMLHLTYFGARQIESQYWNTLKIVK